MVFCDIIVSEGFKINEKYFIYDDFQIYHRRPVGKGGYSIEDYILFYEYYCFMSTCTCIILSVLLLFKQ